MEAVVGEAYCGDAERQLTVQKTSLFYPGDGFAVYDHHSGELVFRVDNYAGGGGVSTNLIGNLPLPIPDNLQRPSLHEVVLMDSSGSSILTLRKKRPSLHHRWEGFDGEWREGQTPLFTVRRPSIFGGDVTVEIHRSDGGAGELRVEGSFSQRSCRMVDRDAEAVVAEIKRKAVEDPCGGGGGASVVVLGRDVFSLHLRPRFDAAFAMGVILALDQISGEYIITDH